MWQYKCLKKVATFLWQFFPAIIFATKRRALIHHPLRATTKQVLPNKIVLPFLILLMAYIESICIYLLYIKHIHY